MQSLYKNEFESFGSQLVAIQVAGTYRNDHRRVDPRLAELNRRALAAGSSEAVPSDGGFLVAPEFSREIVKRMYNTGQILKRCRPFPITSPNANAVRFPQFDESSRVNGSRLGGIESYWMNEADTLTASKPKFMMSELVAQKILALVYVTDSLLQDSDALGSWMTYACAQELTFNLENKIITGNGIGQPLGILHSPALVTVAAEGGQTSGTVVSANVYKMLEAFWAASYNSAGACWLYNQDLLPSLSSLIVLAGVTGGSESKLWQWRTTPDGQNMLAGLPAIQSEYCQSAGTPGDLLLVDLSRYVVAMRENARNELSMDVRFLSDESVFRSILRVNGQPIDRSPVTPANGSVQTSPFVALAARLPS